MVFVVVIAKPTFFVLDTFSASSGEFQHVEEFPEWSAYHQMKTHKEILASLLHWTRRQN